MLSTLRNNYGRFPVKLSRWKKAIQSDIDTTKNIPFWNSNSKIISDRLYFPNVTRTDEFIPDNKQIYNSSNSEQFIKKRRYKFVNVNGINNAGDSLIVTRKIKFVPNATQKQFLKNCFGAYRYVYNKTIDFLKFKYYDKKTKEKKFKAKFGKYRKLIVETFTKDQWIKKIPFDNKTLSIKNCFAMYKSAKSNGHMKNEFVMDYLKKKTNKQVAYFDYRSVNGKFILCPNFLKSKLKINKKDKKFINSFPKNENNGPFTHNFIIEKNIYGYFILMAYDKPPVNAVYANRCTVALDPGMRTFQTYYSDFSYGKLGTQTSDKVRKFHERIDKLTNILDTYDVKAKTRYNIKRRLRLLRTKVTNIVNDLHWKIANYLVKRHNVILLPKFETQNIVKQSKNKILNRTLNSLAHYKFKLRLIYKASTIKNTHVLICKEHHTTKTCGKCGAIDNNVGHNKTYDCKECGLKIDRDYNGARNIYIRSLTKVIGCG